MSEIEDLKKELQALKDQLNPPPRQPSTHLRRDLTEGACMPRSAMQAMIDAVPESVMAGLRADARKPNPVTTGSSPITSTPSAQPQRAGSGWRDRNPSLISSRRCPRRQIDGSPRRNRQGRTH